MVKETTNTSMVKREQYVVIQGWMLTELKLKSTELLVYAIIYGFSQADNTWFTGSLQYLADWTNTSKRNVMYILDKLVAKGFIQKREIVRNNVKFCELRTNFMGGEIISPVVKYTSQGGEIFSRGGEIISPNNIVNNLDNKLVILKEKNTKKEKTLHEVLDAVQNDRLKEALVSFCKMRNAIKSPLTAESLELNIKKLFELSSDLETMIEIVNQSVCNNWKTFYEIKRSKNNRLPF